MIRFVFISLAASLLAMGCTSATALVSSAKKQELRKLLSPKFDLKSVPLDREEDFYHIMAAFAASDPGLFDERVREVRFRSVDEAEVFFSDMFMHGGGSAKVTRKEGRWVITGKIWKV